MELSRMSIHWNNPYKSAAKSYNIPTLNFSVSNAFEESFEAKAAEDQNIKTTV